MSDLPRTSLERVLARAAELQNSTQSEPGDTISEARLVEIAKEVGLDVNHVRQALAEERAGAAVLGAESGALSSVGPSVVSAQRTVTGTPDQLLKNMDAYLPRNEYLTCVRRTGDRMVWEPRRDPLGNFFRSFGSGGRRFDLVRVDQLIVTATAIDDTRSVLRFDALVHGARKSVRNGTLGALGLMLLMCILAAIPLVFLSVVIPQVAVVSLAVMAAITGGVTWFSWRALKQQFRGMVSRVQTRMEFLLDEAQQGRLEPAPSLLDRMLRGPSPF